MPDINSFQITFSNHDVQRDACEDEIRISQIPAVIVNIPFIRNSNDLLWDYITIHSCAICLGLHLRGGLRVRPRRGTIMTTTEA
jgi:hypothetical protein